MPQIGGTAAAEPIRTLLSVQKGCGIDVVSDGQLLRTSACSLFAGNVAGVRSDSDGNGKPYVAGLLERKSPLTAPEVDILKRTATAPFKITLPAPTVAATELFREGVTNEHYPTRRDLAQALAAILRQEIADLIAEGVPYIQLDGPAYEASADRAGAAKLGGVDEMLSLDSQALRDLPRPEKLKLAIHLPRARDASGALLQSAGLPEKRAAMLESALARLPVDRFLIEFPAEPGEADFAPLRGVPQGSMAVLGLVDPLAPRADEVDPLLDRLDLAVTFIGAERLALSPRRGFATPGAARDAHAFEAQRRSLTLTAEAARRFWGFEM
ncbi:MAG: hypothetical protein ACRET2_12915 [Steroidobacteraceae bacterium]